MRAQYQDEGDASVPSHHPSPFRCRFFGVVSNEAAWEAVGRNVLADTPPAA